MGTCFWCEGTGKFKKPRDEEKYSEIFDRYDAPGTLSMGECRKRALEEVGYDLVKCKHCNGTGIQKRLKLFLPTINIRWLVFLCSEMRKRETLASLSPSDVIT